LSNPTARSVLTAILISGAIACSDSADDPPLASGGTSGSGGAAGAGGSPVSAGTGGRGAAGGGAAGAPGGAGAGAGGGGAAGVGGAVIGVDSGFPPPDKLVALTFDDGPDPTLTGAVLDKLQSHDVPASFFLIGAQIDAGDAAVLQRAASLGCEFENHSNGFASLSNTAADQIEASVNATNTAIQNATGTAPVFFRPPNLAIDQNLIDTVDLAIASGLVGGDFPGGNQGGNPTVESVTNVILDGVEDGTIILLHDVQPSLNPQVTPDALDNIIPELKSQGYEFVTLRQLFQRRGIDPTAMPDVVWTVVPPN
jgi:peptidoglycan-N-acetylglucosamine deacetylase